MAYGLAHLYRNNNSSYAGNDLMVTKPSATGEISLFHDTGVPLIEFNKALIDADIVVLAIPAKELKKFVIAHFQFLRTKILVDVTNSSVPGEDLHSFLGLVNVSWVKAFNDIGAVDILLNKPNSKNKIASIMCSSNKTALDIVKSFAEESLGMAIKVVPFERYEDIALEQNSYGDEWCHAAYVLLFIFAISETYAILRYNVFKGYEWFHLPIQVTNKGVCWTAINGFALTQIPGVLARLSHVIYGNTLRNKSTLLLWGLKIRKQLGILSLWLLFVHTMMSLLIFNEKYYGKFFIDPSAGTSKLNSVGETSFLFAILGTGLYTVMGISSLPSVGSQMTHKQWQLIYGPVAWSALLFGTVHVLIMGVKGWDDQDTWPGNMPPITMTSVLLPLLALFLKLVLMISSFFAEVVVDPHKKHRSYVKIDSTLQLTTSADPTSDDFPEDSDDAIDLEKRIVAISSAPSFESMHSLSYNPLVVASRDTIEKATEQDLNHVRGQF